MNWIVENWDGVVATLVALHALAVAVVNLTPTPKDDEILGKVYRVVEVVAGLFTKKSKGLPGEGAR
jgi:hypothetical protein